jgi:hypothetical protein
VGKWAETLQTLEPQAIPPAQFSKKSGHKVGKWAEKWIF